MTQLIERVRRQSPDAGGEVATSKLNLYICVAKPGSLIKIQAHNIYLVIEHIV